MHVEDQLSFLRNNHAEIIIINKIESPYSSRPLQIIGDERNIGVISAEREAARWRVGRPFFAHGS